MLPNSTRLYQQAHLSPSPPFSDFLLPSTHIQTASLYIRPSSPLNPESFSHFFSLPRRWISAIQTPRSPPSLSPPSTAASPLFLHLLLYIVVEDLSADDDGGGRYSSSSFAAETLCRARLSNSPLEKFIVQSTDLIFASLTQSPDGGLMTTDPAEGEQRQCIRLSHLTAPCHSSLH